MATAPTNPDLLYQPDEQPPHLAAVGLGFQSVMGRLAAMAATASIIASAGGQSDSYLSWIFFSALVVCGLGTSLQIYRIWRFGSGYALSIVSGTAFIAVCTSALLEGGPAMLSSLIVVSAVVPVLPDLATLPIAPHSHVRWWPARSSCCWRPRT